MNLEEMLAEYIEKLKDPYLPREAFDELTKRVRALRVLVQEK